MEEYEYKYRRVIWLSLLSKLHDNDIAEWLISPTWCGLPSLSLYPLGPIPSLIGPSHTGLPYWTSLLLEPSVFLAQKRKQITYSSSIIFFIFFIFWPKNYLNKILVKQKLWKCFILNQCCFVGRGFVQVWHLRNPAHVQVWYFYPTWLLELFIYGDSRQDLSMIWIRVLFAVSIFRVVCALGS